MSIKIGRVKVVENKSGPIKTRFSPSPTGLVHLGNVRTALFNALFALKHQGVFLLRIEDTDRERSKTEFSEALMRDLRWLGLDWQEGPYYQSERQSIYDGYYQQLIDQGLAYPCFCCNEELALMRKVQRSQGQPPRYAGTCRNLSPADIETRQAAGDRPTLRFRVPDEGDVRFTDTVRGEQCFRYVDIGDFIIRRADGTSPFMFCNAVDDAMMGVTHVFRGEDHLTNTPRQVMILSALGLSAPQYGHIALIVGPDGSPLSKRHGSRSIDELRNVGYLPMAVVNYLARLGHYYGHDDYLDLPGLAAAFDTAHLSKSPAKFNEEQLNFWQKSALTQVEAQVIWDWLDEDLQAVIPEQQQLGFLQLVRPNVRFPGDMEYWLQVIFGELPALDRDQMDIIEQAGSDYFNVAWAAYQEHGKDSKKITQALKDALGVKGKALFQPLRIALTGQSHGPELVGLLELMNDETIQQRFHQVLLVFNNSDNEENLLEN